MIQANELRIGNIVHVDGLHGNINMSISAITQKATLEDSKRVIFFKQDKEKVGEFLEHCYPIILTVEMLEKCGFEFVGSAINNESVVSVYGDYAKGKFVLNAGHHEWWFWSSPFNTMIKYLHQLQNLYFALTGEELEITFAV